MAKCSLIAVACSLCLSAFAVADTRTSFNLPAGGLVEALKELARQSDIQLLYQPEQLQDLKTEGLKGSYSPQEAVSILLKGTTLRVHSAVSGAMVIAPASAAQEAAANSSFSSGKTGLRSRIRLARNAASERGGDSEGLEEIIVTAQKRRERLQDVPISISVVAGDRLDTSTDQGVSEALSHVPGVTAMAPPNGIGETLLSVRGVTAPAVIAGGSSPIAYYLDFVPFSFVKSAFAPDSNGYDMERIEILRGPQGTLYGASAQNGVMRVLTHAADLSEFELKARASASSTERGGDNARIDSAINVPIVPDVLAARLVVGYQDLSGWIDKPFEKDANDGRIRNARLRVDAQPSDALSLTLSSWNSRSNYGATSGSADGRSNPSLVSVPLESDFDVFGFRASYDFNGMSLSSTSGYLDYYHRSLADYALLGVPDTTIESIVQAKAFSQEVLLQSTGGGAWRWSLGAMYRDARDRLYQFRRQYAQPTDFRDTSESVAVFGELTRLFLDGRFELTGGLRYFEDDVSSQEYSRGTIVAVTEDELIRSEASFHKVSPRAVLTWHPSNQWTAYASYSEGFRSGFPQNGNIIAVARQFPPLEADNLKNHEVGTKGSFWDSRLKVEAAAFYIDWQDIQQTLTVNIGTDVNPVTVSAQVNGESASGPGAELALSVEPVERLILGLNVSWNDLTMDADVISAGAVLFRKGDRLSLSPEYIAGVSAEYSFPLSRGNKQVRIWTGANYTSESAAHAIVAGQGVVFESDALLVGRAGVSLDNDHWIASFFIDNVTDEDGVVQGAANLPRSFDTRLRPRTTGVQFEYRYGAR